jgi:AraC-like DNA-binding protein
MQKITPLPLLSRRHIKQLVEQRRGFQFDMCELSIYETRKKVLDFPLSFGGFTVTSMLRGTKTVRFEDATDQSYNPGNTIITPSYNKLNIDFPKASLQRPTQCTALVIDNFFVKQQIDQINELTPELGFITSWRLLDNPVLLKNNADLVAILEKVNRISISTDPFKKIHIQLLLKELVLCVLKLQNISTLNEEAAENTNSNPFTAVVNFIRQNICQEIQIEDLLRISAMSKSTFYRAFGNELGTTPYQLIMDERLKIAKKLLVEERLSVKETAYASGFSSPNYFIRLFKKYEGITPKQYKYQQLQ